MIVARGNYLITFHKRLAAMRRMGIHMPEPVITVCTTKHRGYALTGKYANIHYLSRSFCHYRQLLSNCRVLLDSRDFTTITSHRLANANILPYNISDRNIGICVNIPRGGNSYFCFSFIPHVCTRVYIGCIENHGTSQREEIGRILEICQN